MYKFGWVISFVLIGVLASCSSSQKELAPIQTPVPPPTSTPVTGEVLAEFPDLGALDSYNQTSAISDMQILVEAPTLSQHAVPENATLWLLPRDGERAWAIYRITPPDGELLEATAIGSDTLWLGVADYGSNRWTYAEFTGGVASIDLSTLDFPYSPEGYVYLAVICPVENIGLLDALSLVYDSNDWGLTIETWDSRLMLSWNEMPYEGYQIYRSTLASDIAPYLIGSTPELGLGLHHFNEYVPENAAGEWVPEVNDNATPSDLDDDFPTIAPGVEYYYRICPVLRGVPLGFSPEIHDMIAWGDRVVTDRPWPNTSQTNVMFTTGLDIGALTEAQLQWMAENYSGSIGQTKDEADLIRAYNPEFKVLGKNWLALSGELEAEFGNTVDANGDYPYVDKHESWFEHVKCGHPECETQNNGRVGNTMISLYFLTDPGSGFQKYYGLRNLEQLGENHLDGWIGMSIYPNWGVEPEVWWTGNDVIAYQSPKFKAAFTAAGDISMAHPQNPLNIAQLYWLTFPIGPWSEVEADYDLSDTDGVFANNYILIDPYEANLPVYYSVYWIETQNRALAYNRDAGKLILNINRPAQLDLSDRYCLFEYCSYLLIRGDNTYYNLETLSDGKPRWYPELDWDLGAPLDDPPMTIEELEWHPFGGESNPTLYRREFENGFVVVNPFDSGWFSVNVEEDIEILWPQGGGVVGDAGIPDGYIDWELPPWPSFSFYSPGEALIFRPAE